MKYTGPLYAKIPGTRKYVKLCEDSEYVDNLETKLAEARAEIEMLKHQLEDESMRADGMTTAHAEAGAKTEIERKDKLIEQMREALRIACKACDGDCCWLCKIKAALAAGRGK